MTTEHAPAAALARRFADRLADLGLTEAQAAARAGMSTAYLHRVLELGPDFDPPALLRLSAVLALEYEELVAGRPAERVDRTGGPALAGPPVLRELGVAECWQRLGVGGLGRIARTGPEGPVVRPVGYLVHEHAVLYRTTEDGSLAPGPGGDAAFEVDRADRDLHEGWSVLMVGPLEYVTEPALLAELPEPAAHGRWVRLTPTTVTGRSIRSARPH
ncbi:pyridoxamine 5'-phosphate oxidase family protein [Kitasatospora sp. NA04385]|uniref:pyridoxamine 5'-phosphate oxidase family protein n=1 Tax=Kitasatospora sp. NA04385 TaxID=2742135 RepID=UPI001590896B|nr:pyridoxamine 5'-phosphate oxidase family protein [Kitasatospora sp. NA04385]QKW18334.1 pyridoxamine 5'-phosphate oxidase family protein [Kitasatospora sp. NA04385]